MNGPRTVVVTGAGSQLGVFLLPRLQAAGFEVFATSRRASAKPLRVADRVNWVQADHAPKQVRYLASCGPISLAVAMVRQVDTLEKAVVFSTSSVRTKRDSADLPERICVSDIALEEEKLKSICSERGVALTLLRPTLIYGCGLDRNISLLLRQGERMGFIPLSRRATGRRQPVHADDLAGLAVDALSADTGPLLAGELCGGSTLNYREMARRTAACSERRIRLLELPATMLVAIVRAAAVFGPWKDINAEMVHRQAIDMVFDDSVFREKLGWNPRPFEPTTADFSIPPQLEKFRFPV